MRCTCFAGAGSASRGEVDPVLLTLLRTLLLMLLLCSSLLPQRASLVTTDEAALPVKGASANGDGSTDSATAGADAIAAMGGVGSTTPAESAP